MKGEISVELIEITGSFSDVAAAARVSFDAASKSKEDDKRLFKYLLDHYEWSPFEMIHIKYRIKAPLFAAKQFYRHRTVKTIGDEVCTHDAAMVGYDFFGAVNELSMRYKVSETEFYIPFECFEQGKKNKQSSGSKLPQATSDYITERMEELYTQIEHTYHSFIEMGLAREQARMILPQATFTKFLSYTSLRHLMEFLKLRLASDSQDEIRHIAKAMLMEIAKVDNDLFELLSDYFIKEAAWAEQRLHA
ncbi:MAG: FAD-dependent thymidylate synthase [Paraclostridium sp.]